MSTYEQGRKQHRMSSVEDVIRYVQEKGVVTVTDVAAAFDISYTTARRNLDAGVARKELVMDTYSPEGVRLPYTDYRYGAVG
jgi:response regulator of citrate/malate metabolism